MDRREALKRVALIMGTAVATPLATAVLNGCQADGSSQLGDWTPKFLSKKQASVLMELAERIIPRTDTPGAKDALVHEFIDTMLAEFYGKEEADRYAKMLDDFDLNCKKDTGKSFVNLTDEERDAHLVKVQDAAYDAASKGTKTEEIFWFNAKQGTMMAFFVSEAGATQVLQYEPIPGDYKGCVPLSEAGEGRTWTS